LLQPLQSTSLPEVDGAIEPMKRDPTVLADAPAAVTSSPRTMTLAKTTGLIPVDSTRVRTYYLLQFRLARTRVGTVRPRYSRSRFVVKGHEGGVRAAGPRIAEVGTAGVRSR
jgi:hypothetical protein